MPRKLRTFATALFATVAATLVSQPPAMAHESGHAAVVLDVQTYNLDLGADLTPLFGATDIPSLRAAATGVYGEVQASLPEERMRAAAAIIARQDPDVVGLQEVALWSLAPYQFVGPFPVAVGPYQPSYDFLALLLDDFNVRPTMCATGRIPPDPNDANTVAYATLQAAGLREVWPLLHPGNPCSPASWTSTLSHRIDDVFLSSQFSALHTEVVGDTARELSRPHGFWPSDHASTVATVRLGRRS